MATPPAAALALFVKNPEPGHVKTRLAAALGAERAARFYRECMLTVLAKSLRLHGVDVFIFFLPRDQGPAVEQLVMTRFGRFEGRFVPQAQGDLGGRLHAALAHLHGLGYTRQFVLGTDSPTLPLEILQRGVDALEAKDAVLGPTWNGAFYMIGVKEPDARVFAGVGWGSGMELSQTYANLAGLGRAVALLPRWQDVDSPDDLPFLEGQIRTADYQRLKAILEGEGPKDEH